MPRGARPGERRGGRKAGTPNKVTAMNGLREKARAYTADAIEELVYVMRQNENLPAKVAAARELLDRAWGRPAQPVSGPDTDGPVRLEVTWLPPEPAPPPETELLPPPATPKQEAAPLPPGRAPSLRPPRWTAGSGGLL